MLLHFQNALYSFLFTSSRTFSLSWFCSLVLSPSSHLAISLSFVLFASLVSSVFSNHSLSLSPYSTRHTTKNLTKLAIVPIIVRLVHTKYSHNWLGKCVYRLYVIYVTAISFVWISIFRLRRVLVHVYVIWVSFAGSFQFIFVVLLFSLHYFLMFAYENRRRPRGSGILIEEWN